MTHRITKKLRWIGPISLLFCLPTIAVAQGEGMIIIVGILEQVHKVADLSVGFSTTSTTNTPDGARITAPRMQFGICGHEGIGGEVDLALHAGTPEGQSGTFNMFEYLFGPRFNTHKGRATMYGHILAGGVYQWESGGDIDSSAYEGGGFAMAFGGGVDVDVSEKIAVRIVQVDWIPVCDNECWENNTFRFGVGLVFRSGK